jgi:DNA uptake protein ComE-like DNA-binding protein
VIHHRPHNLSKSGATAGLSSSAFAVGCVKRTTWIRRSNHQMVRFTHPTAGRPGRNGMVLFIVVIVIAMLSLAGLSFVSMMSTENKAVHLRGDELRLEAVAGSGSQLIRSFVRQPYENRQAAGGIYNNPGVFQGVLVLDDETAGRRGRFSVISPNTDTGEVSGIRFGVQNESARLNLAVLPSWEAKKKGSGRDALTALPGMTQSMADAILDWVDVDDKTRQFGAESGYYAGLGVPYGPRNAEPSSLEELLLIRDVTRNLLFGRDTNLNYRIDDAEEQTTLSDFESAGSGNSLPWSSLLTVYSAEKNLTSGGKPRIDLNEKNLTKLDARLRKVFNKNQTGFIILYRQYGPYRGGEAPRSRSKAIAKPDMKVAGEYRFTTVLDVIGAKVRIPVEPNRSSSSNANQQQPTHEVINSPFTTSQGSMRRYMARLVDNATVDRKKVIRGRINLNRAPQAVLEAVPGMDKAVAGQIAGSRSSDGFRGAQQRRLPTWPLTEGLVNLDKMKELLPYVTVGGDVYRAQVVGFFDDGGPFARAEIVVDATADPPRQVYYKDLRLLGRGYSLEALGAEASDTTLSSSLQDNELFEAAAE